MPTSFAVEYQHERPASEATPRHYVKDPSIARLFHTYISNISLWYDLSDAAQSFGTAIPSLALDEPMLFHAIIALAAMHVCKTSTEGSMLTAQHHHTECVKHLISLEGDHELVRRGIALVATCLLRSYEILESKLHYRMINVANIPNHCFSFLKCNLTGDTDPNVHLRGAYSMASLPRPPPDLNDAQGLAETGFWNYLREDITFSLHEHCPLKMDLEQYQHAYEYRTDEDYLNLLTIVLGRIINAAFGDRIIASNWASSLESLCWCFERYPKHMFSFSRTAASKSSPLPVVWFTRPCHGLLSPPLCLH